MVTIDFLSVCFITNLYNKAFCLGLIYVVDSADPSRFQEAKDELFGIIADEKMSDIPILVLANKQDISCAQSLDIVSQELGLVEIPEHQKWSVNPCSAVKGEGITEGLQVFSQMVKEFKKQQKKQSKKAKE